MGWESFAIQQSNKLDDVRLQLLQSIGKNIKNLSIINKVAQLIEDQPNDQELGEKLRENFKDYLEGE